MNFGLDDVVSPGMVLAYLEMHAPPPIRDLRSESAMVS